MMHKLPDFDSLGGYLALPRIDRSSVRLLWSDEFWDGPCSGMLLFRGQQYWFQSIEENEGDGWFRRFLVVELSDAQLREECSWHDLFREKVGTHMDYDAEGNATLRGPA